MTSTACKKVQILDVKKVNQGGVVLLYLFLMDGGVRGGFEGLYKAVSAPRPRVVMGSNRGGPPTRPSPRRGRDVEVRLINDGVKKAYGKRVDQKAEA